MPTLKYRRYRGDMIETFKIPSGIYDKEVTDGMLELDENTRTRGHKKKLKKMHCKLNIHKKNSEWNKKQKTIMPVIFSITV